MSEVILTVYLIGYAITFVAGLFIFEEPWGRGSTGRTDFEAALGFALFWPVILLIGGALFAYAAWKGDKG